MRNNLWAYFAGGIIVLLILGAIIFSFGFPNKDASKNLKSPEKNLSLEKYRSEDIPEDCRLPEGNSDVEWWKQHLSHHKPTWYCLDYYGTSIEEMTNQK